MTKSMLLALIATSVISCSGSLPGTLRYYEPKDVIKRSGNETVLSSNLFLHQKLVPTLCLKSAYTAGNSNGNISSVRATIHCLAGIYDKGFYEGIFFQDTTGDGYAERVCRSEGFSEFNKTFPHGIAVDKRRRIINIPPENCYILSFNKEKNLGKLAEDAKRWVAKESIDDLYILEK